MTSLVDVSIAECGVTDCDVRQLVDHSCNQTIAYVDYGQANATNYMAAVFYYTSNPAMGFRASSCGTAYADFYDAGWNLVESTPYVNDSTGLCIPAN